MLAVAHAVLLLKNTLVKQVESTYMSLILFLDLCIDASLPGGLVELPLGHLEEVGGLPEPHLPAADHLDGVLERLVLRQLRTID